MEVILNGVNGRNVQQLVEVVSNGSHELVPTRNRKMVGKPVRNRDLDLTNSPKNVTLSLAVRVFWLLLCSINKQ